MRGKNRMMIWSVKEGDNMNRTKLFIEWENERIRCMESSMPMDEVVFLKYCTEDFKIRNLKDNSLLGQGVNFGLGLVNSELERKLKFKIVQSMTAGEFEVFNYEVINAKGEKGSGTFIYRFRNDKVSEMILLDHD